MNGGENGVLMRILLHNRIALEIYSQVMLWMKTKVAEQVDVAIKAGKYSSDN